MVPTPFKFAAGSGGIPRAAAREEDEVLSAFTFAEFARGGLHLCGGVGIIAEAEAGEAAILQRAADDGVAHIQFGDGAPLRL